MLAAVALAGCGGGAKHVSIAVHAASPLADAPVRLDVRGLDGAATLRARWTSLDGTVWTSSTPLHGSVELRGVRGMRFLWGMKPAHPTGSPQFFSPPERGPSDAALSVVRGRRTLARASLSRRVTPAAVRMRRLTVRRDGVYGYLFTPPGGGSHPAVLTFGGSEGGDSTVDEAGLLAAHGYTTLALAYFKEPGLPRHLVRIPLEYFARAVRLLRRQPHVDPARVVTMGASRGGEASLLVASTFPRLIHGAIGLVPSSEVYPSPDRVHAAWTYRGEPLGGFQPIPVWRIDGPILTVGAGQDAEWNSSFYVAQIEDTLRQHHFRFHHEALTYPKAGHLIGGAIPYQPAATDERDYGGTPAADAAACADLWPKILRYLAAL